MADATGDLDGAPRDVALPDVSVPPDVPAPPDTPIPDAGPDVPMDTCVPTTWFADVDNDGFGTDITTTTTCERPAGFVAQSGDCDDENPARNPGLAEICDRSDNNCNGQIDESGCGDCRVHLRDKSVYLLCRTERTWHQARAECIRHGYNLATVDSFGENTNLYTAFGFGAPSYWIGLLRTDAGWNWVEGMGGYRGWRLGEPSGDGDCAAMAPGGWNDAPCNARDRYVCEGLRAD